MLSFGQGDHAVTSHHWWSKHTHILKELYTNTRDHGQSCWEDTLNASGVQFPEWKRDPARSTELGTSLITPFSGICYSKISQRGNTSKPANRNTGHINNGINLFMGRGSLSVTSPPWSCKVTLWFFLALLLILSAMITGSPTPGIYMEGQTSLETKYDILVTDSPDDIEPTQEEKTDLDIRTTPSPHYENTTFARLIDDELADRLPRSVRATVGSAKHRRNKKKSSNGGGEDKSGKGCSLKSLTIKVEDLGLGYKSDDYITFHYCSGTCQNKRTNYDLTLAHLIKGNHLSRGRVSSHPCCRPTSYEPVNFLNENIKWQEVPAISAAGCECVG
ncbi:artemin [Pelobates fuscus]|uniref:artemin n=1 Tax=Pelobates fuscus TaxID=191477 RepID=UPI002FE4824C